jgi:cyclopropane-fatty-acyl-phospholipid synthase
MPGDEALAMSSEGTLQAIGAFLARLHPRDFTVRLWDGRSLPPEEGATSRFTIILTHPASLRRMAWPPSEITVAEAFIRRDFDVEGDLVAALGLRHRWKIGPGEILALLPFARELFAAPPPAARERAARLRGGKHSWSRDAEAVRHHYDLGNDFYALWLDRRMVYSCAFFPEPETSLDDAQEAKLDLVCRKLRLREGERLLDVGCGWGGLVLHAAERYGVSALGITLSPRQAELARERVRAAGLARRVRIEICDYRRLREAPFDKIVSVGMVEHVGVAELPAYFRQAARLLRPGGLFLNHGISPLVPRDEGLRSKVLREGGFVQKYVFPDSELPFVHECAAAAVEAGLELRDVESLREHYALTLRHWLARLEGRQRELERIAGATTFRIYRLYLAGAAADFERAHQSVFQSLFVRSGAGPSGLPLTRAEWVG